MDTPAAPMPAADDAMGVLNTWQEHPPAAVLDAAQTAPFHLHRALARQWWTLTPLARADLCALRIAAEDLAEHGPAALAQDGAARLAPIIRECAYFAHLAEPARPADTRERERAVRRAAGHLAAYQRLTEDRQASVLAQLTPSETTTNRLLGALDSYLPPVPVSDAGARLEAALAEAAGGEPTPPPARLGHVMRKGLAALPKEWQQQVMRRIGAGTTPLDALSGAVRARTRARQQGGPAAEDGPQGA